MASFSVHSLIILIALTSVPSDTNMTSEPLKSDSLERETPSAPDQIELNDPDPEKPHNFMQRTNPTPDENRLQPQIFQIFVDNYFKKIINAYPPSDIDSRPLDITPLSPLRFADPPALIILPSLPPPNATGNLLTRWSRHDLFPDIQCPHGAASTFPDCKLPPREPRFFHPPKPPRPLATAIL